MKKLIIYGTLKILSFIILFTVILSLMQPLFVPKFMWDGSATIYQFYNLEKNSVDLLFLGASQTFCGINTEKLNTEYHTSSYDFGASGQRLPTTYYYLQEALKYQSPKIVMIEICHFYANNPIDDKNLAWNYSTTKTSIEKYASLRELTNDELTAIKYCFFPLLMYHSRWNSIDKTDLEMKFKNLNFEYMATGGYFPNNSVEPQTLAYTNENDGEIYDIPETTDKAIKSMVKLCSTPPRNINVIFYKSPDAVWTRNESKAVKEYMAQNGYTFLDLHDHLDEIGIDPATDFRDDHHLNTSGANKITDFIANYLFENYNIGTNNPQKNK